MMKRTAAVLLLICVLSVLAACGNKAVDSGEKSNAAEETWTLPAYNGSSEDMSDFKTLDLKGAETDQNIFSQYKYTIVNVWGTYCNPCIEAMPDNEKLYREYKEKGVGMVSIVVDTVDQSGALAMNQVSYAKEIMKQQGADYPTLLPSASVMQTLASRISVTPSYFFVDSKGKLVSTVYEGSRDYKEWVKIIEEETGI